MVACVAVATIAVTQPGAAGAQTGGGQDASANPFAPKDTFCTKAGPAPTKDPIKVVQIRSQLEKYEPLGYSLPVGDVNDMFQVFTDQINACGGIRGRKVVLQNEEYDPTNPASRDAACIAATEDDKAFVVVNANTLTGTGPYCVAGDHKTPLVYVGGATDAQYKETNGRLASYGPSANGQVRLLAGDLITSGALKGKTVRDRVDRPPRPGRRGAGVAGRSAEEGGREGGRVRRPAVPGQHRVHAADPAVGHEGRGHEARRRDPGDDGHDVAGVRQRDAEGRHEGQGLRDVVQRTRHRPRAEQGSAGRRTRSGEVLRRRDARRRPP